MAKGAASHSLVEPSISVNKNDTVPDGTAIPTACHAHHTTRSGRRIASRQMNSPPAAGVGRCRQTPPALGLGTRVALDDGLDSPAGLPRMSPHRHCVRLRVPKEMDRA